MSFNPNAHEYTPTWMQAPSTEDFNSTKARNISSGVHFMNPVLERRRQAFQMTEKSMRGSGFKAHIEGRNLPFPPSTISPSGGFYRESSPINHNSYVPAEPSFYDPHFSFPLQNRNSKAALQSGTSMRAEAHEYIPTFLRKPSSVSAPVSQSVSSKKEKATFEVTLEKPIVLLFLGCRGAGKTTLAKMAAEKYNLLHISSGDIYKEQQNPFDKLKRIVSKEFVDALKPEYCGLALDRFVVRSEIDAYYLEDILTAANLPAPITISLIVDTSVGLFRAQQRDDNKQGTLFSRLEEQKIQFLATEKVFKPIHSLVAIDCNKIEAAEAFEKICSQVKKIYLTRSSKVTLPEVTNVFSGILVKNYEVYSQLCKSVHVSIGNFQGRTDSAPLSSMASYVDRKTFAAENLKRNNITSSFVTLKADGERYLLVKHKKKGFLAFPSNFTHCFSVNECLKGVTISPSPHIDTMYKLRSPQEHEIEFALDTEVCVHNDHCIFYVIDFVFLYSAVGSKMRFAQRYNLLQSVIPCESNSVLKLKQYLPVNKLSLLLPSFSNPPFPIDGIVFQHGDVYCFGSDKLLRKWKPKELCTIDFRLANGEECKANGDWLFELQLLDFSEGKWIETSLPNAVGVFTAQEVAKNGLSNSTIVELVLSKTFAGKSFWAFHRCRPDKSGPNKKIIADQILGMEHICYSELLQCTEKILHEPLPASNIPAFIHK